MVQFSSYTSPMDRDYGRSHVSDNSTNDVGIGIQDIGMSVPLGISAANVQGISAKIKSGAGALEIAFPGAVRGQRQAQTPGMYGEDQRQAIREMAKINEVNFTTHASYGINGLAGMDQQGNFSEENRKLGIDEIKRAIEFAGDTAQGGSIVVHTGEFQRPISEEEWAKDPNAPGGYRFKHHGEEPAMAVIRVVDDRTGQVMTQVRKNQKVARAIWNVADESKTFTATKDNPVLGYKAGDQVSIEKGQYIDYEGNPLDISERVPEYDEEHGRFKAELVSWDSFIEEADERNKLNAKKIGMSVSEYRQKYYSERDQNGNMYIEPEEAHLRATLETQEGQSRGWAGYYAEGFEDAKKSLDKLRKALNFYEKLEKETSEEDMWRLKQEAGSTIRSAGSVLLPKEFKMPSEMLQEAIADAERTIEFRHQSSLSQQQQALTSKDSMDHIMSAKKYALNKSYDSYAEAGMHALDMTRTKHLDKPLFITMENIFPESYGAHPDELKGLILKSRERMAEKLHEERNISMGEATKLAETHIKATLDTGHLNTWRKYWQNDPKKNMTQNDEDFKNWMLEKTEDLAKNKIIGNVHLTDNYGYQDDHLAPGQGTTPVKEMVKILKKHGYEGALTVEPGADASTDLSDFHGLMKTWQLFGSPVYSAHGPARTDMPKGNWADIQYSYFGQTNAPYYIFGTYSPSQDWTLFTQVPLE